MTDKKKSKKASSGAGVDLLDKQKAKNKVKPPSKYQVVYHNDDYTPMDLVTISLCHYFHHSVASAKTIMLNVHEKGKGIAGGPYSKEIADTKVLNVVQFFRSQGYPLLAEAEKIE
jgi:ATP-dependent Clp protease adaptor protein ClpS